jgi:hypothetical protein
MKNIIKFICSLIILVLLIISCQNQNQNQTKKDIEVEYRVSGSIRTASITLSNKNGDTEQYSNVTVPWSFNFKPANTSMYYISAQNNDGVDGEVRVSIFIDGKKVKESVSEGAYVIATASHSVWE